jgi:membrane protease YdiL (CAAX protease family)
VVNAMILAPLIEELFFRGIVITFLRSIAGAWPAIIISGVFFGAFHYPLWQFMVPLAVFGMVLGYLYVRTNSLTLVILIHIIFTAKTLLWVALGAPE